MNNPLSIFVYILTNKANSDTILKLCIVTFESPIKKLFLSFHTVYLIGRELAHRARAAVARDFVIFRCPNFEYI
jgi:hypothetical protein